MHAYVNIYEQNKIISVICIRNKTAKIIIIIELLENILKSYNCES